jgi:site-specific recombinase XerD
MLAEIFGARKAKGRRRLTSDVSVPLSTATSVRLRLVPSVSMGRACRVAASAAKLDKRVSMHTLRHNFATHLRVMSSVVAAVPSVL